MALATPEGYRALDETTMAAYLAGLPAIRERLGGAPSDWRAAEVGDGNLNLVFIVEGPAGAVCVKQALPYVRLVGESWPLPLERSFFEHEALLEEARHAQARVPAVLHHDPTLFLIVMERLAPHIIMRRGMIGGVVYPRFAEHITDFLARTLYFTSDLGMPAAEKKQKVAVYCANIELCRITEDLIFTDPYRIAELNRWTSPQLDEDARRIREDDALKRAISRLKLDFLGHAEALVHGDMHTGSIMVTESDTRVIDPEFAYFGPIGFDVGKLIGNLLLCFFSQDGHATGADPRDDYRDWILATAEEVWNGFADKFVALWQERPTGDAYPRSLFEGAAGAASLAEAQAATMRRLFEEALGYAGASMIRRTLGLAHNIDFELIEDPARRAACERRNLRLARDLLVDGARYQGIREVTDAARRVRLSGDVAG